MYEDSLLHLCLCQNPCCPSQQCAAGSVSISSIMPVRGHCMRPAPMGKPSKFVPSRTNIVRLYRGWSLRLSPVREHIMALAEETNPKDIASVAMPLCMNTARTLQNYAGGPGEWGGIQQPGVHPAAHPGAFRGPDPSTISISRVHCCARDRQCLNVSTALYRVCARCVSAQPAEQLLG